MHLHTSKRTTHFNCSLHQTTSTCTSLSTTFRTQTRFQFFSSRQYNFTKNNKQISENNQLLHVLLYNIVGNEVIVHWPNIFYTLCKNITFWIVFGTKLYLTYTTAMTLFMIEKDIIMNFKKK